MNGITPFLWFNADAQAAIEFYVGLFPDSEIVSMGHYGEGVPGLAGKVMHAQFRLQGRDFFAMDAGPQFPFTEAISLFVSCENQAEVDHYWSALTADGGAEQPCGWLKDRWGVSWQIVPTRLGQLMGDPDPAKAQRVMQAMLKMRKIVVKDLQAAYDGK